MATNGQSRFIALCVCFAVCAVLVDARTADPTSDLTASRTASMAATTNSVDRSEKETTQVRTSTDARLTADKPESFTADVNDGGRELGTDAFGGFKPDQIVRDSEQFDMLPPEAAVPEADKATGGITAEQFGQLPPEAMDGITAEFPDITADQFEQLPPEAMDGITAEFPDITADQFGQLPPEAMDGITAEFPDITADFPDITADQFGQLPPEAMDGITADQFNERPPAAAVPEADKAFGGFAPDQFQELPPEPIVKTDSVRKPETDAFFGDELHMEIEAGIPDEDGNGILKEHAVPVTNDVIGMLELDDKVVKTDYLVGGAGADHITATNDAPTNIQTMSNTNSEPQQFDFPATEDDGKDKTDEPVRPEPTDDGKDKTDEPVRPEPTDDGKDKTDEPVRPEPTDDGKDTNDDVTILPVCFATSCTECLEQRGECAWIGAECVTSDRLSDLPRAVVAEAVLSVRECSDEPVIIIDPVPECIATTCFDCVASPTDRSDCVWFAGECHTDAQFADLPRDVQGEGIRDARLCERPIDPVDPKPECIARTCFECVASPTDRSDCVWAAGECHTEASYAELPRDGKGQDIRDARLCEDPTDPVDPCEPMRTCQTCTGVETAQCVWHAGDCWSRDRFSALPIDSQGGAVRDGKACPDPEPVDCVGETCEECFQRGQEGVCQWSFAFGCVDPNVQLTKEGRVLSIDECPAPTRPERCEDMRTCDSCADMKGCGWHVRRMHCVKVDAFFARKGDIVVEDQRQCAKTCVHDDMIELCELPGTEGLSDDCRTGQEICDEGIPRCVPLWRPPVEICGDDIDNNCNGDIDEGCDKSVCELGEKMPCRIEGALGRCAWGERKCVLGVAPVTSNSLVAEYREWSECRPSLKPKYEDCFNGEDDDCDGLVDKDDDDCHVDVDACALQKNCKRCISAFDRGVSDTPCAFCDKKCVSVESPKLHECRAEPMFVYEECKAAHVVPELDTDESIDEADDNDAADIDDAEEEEEEDTFDYCAVRTTCDICTGKLTPTGHQCAWCEAHQRCTDRTAAEERLRATVSSKAEFKRAIKEVERECGVLAFYPSQCRAIECPPGQEFDRETGECDCPNCDYDAGYECVPVKNTDLNTEFREVAFECVKPAEDECNDDECPPHMACTSNGKCECVDSVFDAKQRKCVKCEPPMRFNDAGECVCPKKDGFVLVDGVCSVCDCSEFDGAMCNEFGKCVCKDPLAEFVTIGDRPVGCVKADCRKNEVLNARGECVCERPFQLQLLNGELVCDVLCRGNHVYCQLLDECVESYRDCRTPPICPDCGEDSDEPVLDDDDDDDDDETLPNGCTKDAPFYCKKLAKCFKSARACSELTDACDDGLVKCPSGKCAKSVRMCDPIQSCGFGLVRCADGECHERCDDDSVNEIDVDVCNTAADERLCEDGKCRRECPDFDGCPRDTPVQCVTGKCVREDAECRKDDSVCGVDEVQCYSGACAFSKKHCGKDIAPAIVKPLERTIDLDWAKENGGASFDVVAHVDPSKPIAMITVGASDVVSEDVKERTSALVVKPVADSKLQLAKHVSKSGELTADTTVDLLKSSVVDITLGASDADKWVELEEPIEITMPVAGTPVDDVDELTETMCLAYLDRSEDSCSLYNGPSDHSDCTGVWTCTPTPIKCELVESDVLCTGETTHLTPYVFTVKEAEDEDVDNDGTTDDDDDDDDDDDNENEDEEEDDDGFWTSPASVVEPRAVATALAVAGVALMA